MSIVTLVSGGLDSTLVALLTYQMQVQQFPLFIDYGQKAKAREWAACQKSMKAIGLPEPEVANLSGFGKLVPSGLTDCELDVLDDAFTPGRNTLFLLAAAAYAVRKNADSIAIGLLHEQTCIFSDQTDAFLRQAEILIAMSVGTEIKILTPLRDFRKQDVVELAREKGVSGTYSCHAGGAEPCGNCIACNEFKY